MLAAMILCLQSS